MLSHYFHLKPTPSWPVLLLLNTVFAVIAYWGGMAFFFKTLLVVGLFLFFNTKGESYNHYSNKFWMILFLITLFFGYFLPEAWPSLPEIWIYCIGIPVLGILGWASHRWSLRLSAKSPDITLDTTIIAPLNSMQIPLYISTILFSLSYIGTLCLMIFFTPNWTVSKGIVSAFFIGFTLLCALARQDTLRKKHLFDAQGGEWIRIDANGIQIQSLQQPNFKNGLKQSCVQQQSVTWQEILCLNHHSNTQIMVEMKSRPPHYEARHFFIPLFAPFQSLTDLQEHLTQMKQKFG